MTPVISPWVFYWMPICDDIKFFGYLGGSVGLIVVTIAICCIVGESTTYSPDDDFINAWKGVFKKFFPIAIAFVMVGILTPNEKTITKMIVAQNVTYERVETVTDTVETVYNDIMNLFAESSDSNG